MSQENVEVVREAVRRWIAGEVPWDLFDADIEWSPVDQGPDGGVVYHGYDGLRGWLRDLNTIWKDWRFWPQEFVSAGDQVVAIIRNAFTARASGISLDECWGYLFTLRDGRITQVRQYSDPAEAFEAAGLRE